MSVNLFEEYNYGLPGIAFCFVLLVVRLTSFESLSS